MTLDDLDVVTDTNGTRYALDRVLGHGGQGTVFAVRGRDLAVKVSTVRQQVARQRVRENVARVRRLPLQGLNVARPLRALVEPHAGYVMELMTGMIPLQRLSQPPPPSVKGLSHWYRDSGGLQWRLRVLSRAAALLRALHDRGLAYGDASPHNIFISAERPAAEVWLIDCDNIVHGVSPRPVYTPGYAAPELLRGAKGADSLTDAWSLGTIAFETLCGLHPFDGDLVQDGAPELEEQAFRGELPWIDDPVDRRNAASRGLARPMVLTTSLQRLAAECFGESRVQRERRPTAGAWAEKLAQAADQVITCPGCDSGYYLNAPRCPWCGDPRPTIALVNIFLRDPSLRDDGGTPARLVCKAAGSPATLDRAVVQAGRECTITTRHLGGCLDETPLAHIQLKGKHLVVRGEDGCTIGLEHRQDGRVRPLAGCTEHIELGHGRPWWWLVPLERGKLHRIASFELREMGAGG